MRLLLRRLWREQFGFLAASELVLAGSMVVVGGVVGWTALRDTVVEEMADISTAIGNLDQSYAYSGVVGHSSFTAGSSFIDRADSVDRGLVAHAPGKILVCADVFGSTPMAQAPAVAPPTPPVLPPPAVVPQPEVAAAPPVVIPAPAPVATATVTATAVQTSQPCVTVTTKSGVITVTVSTTATIVPPAAPCPPPAPPCPPPAVAPVCPPVVPNCAALRGLIAANSGCVHAPGFGYGCLHCLGGGLPEGYNAGPRVMFTPPPIHPAPAVVVRAQQAQGIDMRFNVVGNEQLKQLSTMPGVRVLQIAGSGVTDAGLIYLKKLGELEELHLVGSEITDAGLAELAEIGTLKRLFIVSGGISDKGVDALLKMKNLQMLSLPWAQISAEGWARLEKGLPHLTVIR
ncbi:MAG: hypothetical protein JSS27_16250 [Planctomycetes bacterium]|nr:hypothetical protein [Planctomycetota bacterium]